MAMRASLNIELTQTDRPDWLDWCSFGFGLGLLPLAPGTWGSLLGVLLVCLFQFLPQDLHLPIMLLIYLYSIYACAHTYAWLGNDHKAIVIDEVVGMLVASWALPWRLDLLLVSFVAFRCLDIAKPWPICYFEQPRFGFWGVMADDMWAGLFANLITWVYFYCFF